MYSLSLSPYCLTISPLFGAGINRHFLKALEAVIITFSYSLGVVSVTEPIKDPSTGEKESIFFPSPKEEAPIEVPLFNFLILNKESVFFMSIMINCNL